MSLKLTTKQVYDVQPIVQELQQRGHAFIEASEAELADILATLAEGGVTVEHDQEAPVKQGHHFLRYMAPAVREVKAPKVKPSTGEKRGRKPGVAGAPKTYTGIKDGDVFTGTLTDVAEHFSVNRMTLCKAVQKSGGTSTVAGGVSIAEFGKEAPKVDQEL